MIDTWQALSQPPVSENAPSARRSKRILDPVLLGSDLPDEELAQEVFNTLPPASEAIHLCEVYQEFGKYM